ncbi:hypothetical protein L0F63_003830 [Massospora cicadina]|nr:hypothetical protein L0F63_003830 [Massospora cicadina]
MPLSYDDEMAMVEFTGLPAPTPDYFTAFAFPDRARSWSEGLATAIAALDSDFSKRATRLCCDMRSLDLADDAFEREPVSPHPRGVSKLSRPAKVSARKNATERSFEGDEAMLLALSFSQRNCMRFEALSIDIDFIQWVQAKAKELRLSSQEYFDLIRRNFATIHTSTDQLNRLLSEASLAALDYGAFFVELKACLMKAAACLDWGLKHLNSKELELVAPSWPFIQSKLTQAQKYVALVEDMRQLTSCQLPKEASRLLELLKAKSSLYGDNLEAQSRTWAISGFPPCPELHLIEAACDCATVTLLALEGVACDAALSGEVLENWIMSFKVGTKCLVFTGVSHDPLINLLYELEIRLLMLTCKESVMRLSSLHTRKEQRHWEVWLATRLDIISVHLNKIHLWPRPCLPTFDSSEARLCYALVDLVLGTCHAFTSFSQQPRLNASVLGRGVSVPPKPTANFLFCPDPRFNRFGAPVFLQPAARVQD